jgi:hypothetical protein
MAKTIALGARMNADSVVPIISPALTVIFLAGNRVLHFRRQRNWRTCFFIGNDAIMSHTAKQIDDEAAHVEREIQDDAEQFKIASRLLVQWLADRPNPHMTAIVTGSGAELLAGYCTANQRLP